MKKVKKVKFQCPSNWTLVAKFKYVSIIGHSIERCWLLISPDSNFVWLVYTIFNKPNISCIRLGRVDDYPSYLVMLDKAIYTIKNFQL